MKALAIILALAGLASTAPLNAQILSRIPTGQTTAQGSWTLVGRDGNGNQIYERRTQDRNGNIVVQRARRDVNGNMSIISTNTMNGGNNGNNNCSYSQSTNGIGDIIFGRANANTCRDVYSREDGAWYQVGRGPNNNSIYERRIRDGNGNLVIQHARRNPNGTFTILNTRVAGANDKQWKKAQKEQQKAWKKQEKTEDKQMKNDVSKSDYKDWKKGEKAENKRVDANDKAASKGNKGKNK